MTGLDEHIKKGYICVLKFRMLVASKKSVETNSADQDETAS